MMDEQQLRNRLYQLAQSHNDVWNALILWCADPTYPIADEHRERLRGYELTDTRGEVLPDVRRILIEF